MATTPPAPGALRRPTHQHSLLSRAVALTRARLDRRRLVAVALATLAVGLAAQAIQRSQDIQAQLGQTDSVVVANRDLPVGHRIEATDVVLRQRPVGHLPPGSFRNQEDVIGAVVVAATVDGEAIAGHRVSTHRLGLLAGEQALTVPFPLAPPPVVVGDSVEVMGVGVNGGFDGLGADGPVSVTARSLGSARVLVVDDNGITLALGQDQVAPILEQLGGGTVELVFSGPERPVSGDE